MSAAEEKTEAASSSAPSGGGPSKLVLILTAVNILATFAVIGLLFVSFQKDKGKPSVEDISAKAPEAKEGKEGKEAKAEGGEGHGEGADKGKKAEEDKKKLAEFGKMVSLEQFTVNLSTPGSVTPKFVRVNVSLEVPTDEAEAEVTVKMPQVRNTIIDLFNSKRPGDMATAEGRDYLKEEIRNAINGFMSSGKVKGVFFTNFALGS
jgi:flagellar basal body-associated protein FliL